MLLVFQSTVAVASLPIMDKDFRILCFVTERLRKSTMIFVCVSEHDTSQVGDEKTCVAQTRPQCFNRLFRLGSRVDNRQRIFSDQVDVNRPNIERSGE